MLSIRLLSFLILAFFPIQKSECATGAEAAKSEEVINPQALSPTWWNYFQVRNDELKKRIEKTREMLQSIRTSLKKEHDDQILFLIKRIEISLQFLPETVEPTPKIRPNYQPLGEKYEIEDFLMLGKKLRATEEQERSISDKVTLTERNVSSNATHLDNLVAAYINLPNNDPQRLVKGLEIISTKLERVHQEYLLKMMRDDLEFEKATVGLINKEIEFARGHLEPKQENLLRLVEAIQKNEEALKKQQLGIYEALNNLNQTLEKKDSTKAEIEIAKQQLLGRYIVRAILSVKQINNKIQNIFFTIFLEKDQTRVQEALSLIPQLKAELTKYAKERDQWRRNTKSELTHALKALTSDEDEGKESTEHIVKLANQNLLEINLLDNELYFSQFMFNQLSLVVKEQYVDFWGYVKGHSVLFINKMKSLSKLFHQKLFKIGETPVTLWGLLKIFLIAFVAYLLAKLVQKSIKRFGAKAKKVEPSAVYTLSRVAYYFIFYFGLFIAISSAGIEVTAIAFVAGAVTFWIGLGLVPIVTNLAAGILVLLDKNIRRGDVIELESGERGTISEMNVRSSILIKDDGKKMIIPNSEMIIKKTTNHTLSIGTQSLSIPFDVSSEADENQVNTVILEVISKEGFTSSFKPPHLYLVKMDRERLYFKLKIWISQKEREKDPEILFSHYLLKIRKTLKTHNLPL